MSIELKITACSVDDLHRQILATAAGIASAPGPMKLPAPSLSDFSMHDIVVFLESQGYTLAPAAMPEDEVEPAVKKTRRKKPAEPVAQEESTEEEDDIVASEDSVSLGEEVDLDALKAATIDRLQELYFVDAGVPIVDTIRKRHAGKKKFSDLPKELFPVIAAELNAALEESAHV